MSRKAEDYLYLEAYYDDRGGFHIVKTYAPFLKSYYYNVGAGQLLDVTIKPSVRSSKGEKRTKRQNAYYWGVVVKMICEATGDMDKDSVHNGLKHAFLTDEAADLEKGVLAKVRSTTDLNKAEFFEYYIDRIRQWAIESLGLNIPDPYTAYSMFKWLREISDEVA